MSKKRLAMSTQDKLREEWNKISQELRDENDYISTKDIADWWIEKRNILRSQELNEILNDVVSHLGYLELHGKATEQDKDADFEHLTKCILSLIQQATSKSYQEGLEQKAKNMKELEDVVKELQEAAYSKGFQAGKEETLKEIEKYAEQWQDSLPYDFIQDFKNKEEQQ